MESPFTSPPKAKAPVEQLVSSIEDINQELDDQLGAESDEPGVFDLMVSGETAFKEALESIVSLGSAMDRHTQEITRATERLNIAKQR